MRLPDVERVPAHGVSVSAAVLLDARCEAVIVRLKTTFTVLSPVVTLKVPAVAPAGIVMEAGTDASSGSLETSWIVHPPAGAGPLRVTVPVEDVPFATVDGDKARLAM